MPFKRPKSTAVLRGEEKARTYNTAAKKKAAAKKKMAVSKTVRAANAASARAKASGEKPVKTTKGGYSVYEKGSKMAASFRAITSRFYRYSTVSVDRVPVAAVCRCEYTCHGVSVANAHETRGRAAQPLLGCPWKLRAFVVFDSRSRHSR